MSYNVLRYCESNSLLCLLTGSIGQLVSINILNDNTINGRIEDVDENMNIQLSDVTIICIDKRETNFESLQVLL